MLGRLRCEDSVAAEKVEVGSGTVEIVFAGFVVSLFQRNVIESQETLCWMESGPSKKRVCRQDR